MSIDRISEWLEEIPINTFNSAAPVTISPMYVAFSPDGKEYPLPQMPSYLSVELTNACNLKCGHCHYSFGKLASSRELGFMDFEFFKDLVSQAKQHGMTMLLNYSAEPLMHPRFKQFLRYVCDVGVSSYFNTNGTLLEASTAEAISEFYKGTISFSIDGLQKWHEKSRIGSSYEHVAGNLRRLAAMCRVKSKAIKLMISVSNLGQPYEERKAMLNEWLGEVNAVSFGEVNNSFGELVSTPYIQLKIKKRPLCIVPWQTFGVSYAGHVTPCSLQAAQAKTMGNTSLGDATKAPLIDIWHGEHYRAFRKSFSSGTYWNEVCAKCERWRNQFSFPDEVKQNIKIIRNGFWTVFQNEEIDND